MMTIKDYIEELFADIPESAEKKNVMEEIRLNLEEKVQDLVAAGKAEEDAINKSIVDFGDAGEIKRDLRAAGKAGADEDGAKPKKKRNHAYRLWFSIAGSALIIGLMVFINLYYSPFTIWFVYPVFAVLWWPLVMLFQWLGHREKKTSG